MIPDILPVTKIMADVTFYMYFFRPLFALIIAKGALKFMIVVFRYMFWRTTYK